MIIVNLTPHDIHVMNEQEKVVVVIKKSGKVARLETDKEITRIVDGVPFFSTKYGIPICLNADGEQVQFPEQKANIIYIVFWPVSCRIRTSRFMATRRTGAG